MRDAVRSAFYRFNAPLEGEVPWFYQDVKGLVSIGVGILCDPIQLAMNLPMVHSDGSPAARDEIAAEWLRIKNLPSDAKGRTAAMLGHRYALPYTRLRLSQDGLQQTLMGKANLMDAYLTKRFRCVEHDDCRSNEEMGISDGYPSWPADAQLGALSLAWACGPAFRFPKLEAALRRRDFFTASVECFMPEERTISGLRPRNQANKVLFTNAAIADGKLNPEILYYPLDLDAGPVDKDDTTIPEARVVEFPIVHKSPIDDDYDLPDLSDPVLDDDDEPPPTAA